MSRRASAGYYPSAEPDPPSPAHQRSGLTSTIFLSDFPRSAYKHRSERTRDMDILDGTAIEPDGDFGRLLSVLRRGGEPDRVPFFELKSDIEAAVLGEEDGPGWGYVDVDEDALERHVRHQRLLGYDYLDWRSRTFAFRRAERGTGETDQGERSYVQAGASLISSREEFENYPWPDMETVDYSGLDRLAEVLPPKMKIIARFSGVLENTLWIAGYQTLCMMLYDDRELAGKCFDAVGSRVLEYFARCAQHPAVGAVCLGDDMGFKTQTILSPADLREFVLPWHERICTAAQEAGKPSILHSCGNLEEIMDDVIACGWDAKHSFEDQVLPVWEAKERYGDRIAVLGGFDMDKIARFSPQKVREHTSELLQRCGPGGGWALGTGNSVADYVPPQNYVAMLDEGYRRGRYPLDA